MPDYAGGDRRPIASRNLPVFQRLAAALARAGASANAISVVGMLFGIAAGALLVATSFTDVLPARLLFAAAAGAIQLRLLANMLDGMVALASNQASPVGELFNELPDRLSDTAILVGAGYAATGHPALGWAAAAMALFVTYIRAIGKGLGVPGLFQGPMAKSHRMFLLTVAALAMALLPAPAWHPLFTLFNIPIGLIAIALLMIILGGLLTAFRRLRALVTALQNSPPAGPPGGR
jgi:phosphatidylglycerophosphate synthase